MFERKLWIIEALDSGNGPDDPSAVWDAIGAIKGPRTASSAVLKARRAWGDLPTREEPLRAIEWRDASKEQRAIALYEDLMRRQWNGELGPAALPGFDEQYLEAAEALTERQRVDKITRRGYRQFAAVFVGLGLLLLLFRPTREALAFGFVLAVAGAGTGFNESRLMPIRNGDPPIPPMSLLRSLPALRLVGAVVAALIRFEWIGAVAEVLFFFAGWGLGIIVYMLTPSARQEWNANSAS